MPKTEPKIVEKRETRSLKVDLTPEEIMQAATKAADAQQTIVELEAELQGQKENIKGRTTLAEAELSRNSMLVRQKYDFRKVECRVIRYYSQRLLRVIRTDTDQTIEERTMTDLEISELPM